MLVAAVDAHHRADGGELAREARVALVVVGAPRRRHRDGSGGSWCRSCREACPRRDIGAMICVKPPTAPPGSGAAGMPKRVAVPYTPAVSVTAPSRQRGWRQWTARSSTRCAGNIPTPRAATFSIRSSRRSRRRCSPAPSGANGRSRIRPRSSARRSGRTLRRCPISAGSTSRSSACRWISASPTGRARGSVRARCAASSASGRTSMRCASRRPCI